MPRTLFLADDSVTIRRVVELAFHETDVRVVAVGSGREALERIPSVAPDIVLADVAMPGPSGYEVCRSVKASARPVPVLLLAGTFEPFDADEARNCGADGYVTKPFDSRTLVARIDALLKPRTVETPVADPMPAPTDPPPDPDVEALIRELAAAAPIEPTATIPPPADAAPAALTEPAPAPTFSAEDLDAIARAVVARLSDRVVREIAWDVVPDVAEAIVRERLRELEREID